jgi:hypothetical protein
VTIVGGVAPATGGAGAMLTMPEASVADKEDIVSPDHATNTLLIGTCAFLDSVPASVLTAKYVVFTGQSEKSCTSRLHLGCSASELKLDRLRGPRDSEMHFGKRNNTWHSSIVVGTICIPKYLTVCGLGFYHPFKVLL